MIGQVSQERPANASPHKGSGSTAPNDDMGRRDDLIKIGGALSR
jgi:hypothetical protein